MCFSAYNLITTISLLLWHDIILFPTLTKYQPQLYLTLLNCCSEAEEELEYFDEEF
jgi:hypothetical protein